MGLKGLRQHGPKTLRQDKSHFIKLIFETAPNNKDTFSGIRLLSQESFLSTVVR